MNQKARYKVTSKVTVDLKKKTILDAYNIVRVQRDLGFPAYQKGEPIHDLMMEIKRSINKKVKEKSFSYFDILNFWPLTIVVPILIMLILWGGGK